MRHVMKALVLLALILPGSADAIDRSHSFGVAENSSQDAWVTTCTIEAKRIDSPLSYYGFIRVWYDNYQGTVTQMADVPYALAPSAKNFSEESPGIYKASGKLSKSAVVITIQVTRYGPLTVVTVPGESEAETGQFGCWANIVEGTGPSDPTAILLHEISGEQRVVHQHY